MARWKPDLSRAVWRSPPLPSGSAEGYMLPPEGVTVDKDPVTRDTPESYGILVSEGVSYGGTARIWRVLSTAPTFTRWRVGEYVASIPSKVFGGTGLNNGAVGVASSWGLTVPDAVQQEGYGLWGFWVPVSLSADDPNVLKDPNNPNLNVNVNVPPPAAQKPPGLDLMSLLFFSQQSADSAAARRAAEREQDRRDAADERRARLEDLDYQEQLDEARERRRQRRQAARR